MGCEPRCQPRSDPSHDEAALPLGPDVTRVLVENRRAFLGFLEKRTGDRAIAEDILQEAFARGLEKLETLRDDEAVKAWFYRSLRNAVVDQRRRARAAASAATRAAAETETVALPVEAVEDEACRCVLRLAETLKPEYAQALRRIEVDGVSVKSFAAELGISESNAGVRIFRAREALRRRLSESCGACAVHGCARCTCASGGCA